MSARSTRHGNIAVISIDNPPVNALGLTTRKAIAAALRQAQEDPQISAIVLTGAGATFSGGADIREFDSAEATAQPDLLTLIAALESADKPVVAAVHSLAFGGGLELALGAHYRIGAPGCRLALPEVKLGLVPGAGGTQRLPRVLGVETALNMIIRGEPVMSEVLAALPGQKLFDRMAASAASLLDEAVAFARSVAEVRPLPLVRQLACSHPRGDAYFQFARNMLKGMAKNLPAPVSCVDAVEIATKHTLDEGLRLELSIFHTLLRTPECRSLRHLFIAERAAAKIADVGDDTPQRIIATAAVIGAGTMGGGIAMCLIEAGIPVTLVETRQDALERGIATIRKNYESQVKKGKLKQERLDARMSLLSSTLSYPDIQNADLVLEAVFEDMEVKRQIFERLDAVMQPRAILASNTSTLDLNQIAAFTRRPEDVVGLHFFSPANVMKLLEVVRGERTGKDVLATAMQLAKTLRKTAVVSGVCDGFIGNRMIEQYLRQAARLVVEGAMPHQVDRAIEDFGFAMGPFRMSDMAGNDIAWAIRQRRASQQPNLRPDRIADQLCELGRFGQKTGAGWYDYKPGRRDAIVSPVIEDLIVRHRRSEGSEPRRIESSEIVERLVYALVNEGARIVEEGIAARASDIDVVYVTGYGFPAHRGGPMKHADLVGLPHVMSAMQRFARNPLDDATFWQPATLIRQLVADGKTFN